MAVQGSMKPRDKNDEEVLRPLVEIPLPILILELAGIVCSTTAAIIRATHR